MSWKVYQVLTTLIAASGFVGLLVASVGSPHADRLRWAALIWLAAVGVINAVIVLRERRADPKMQGRERDRA